MGDAADHPLRARAGIHASDAVPDPGLTLELARRALASNRREEAVKALHEAIRRGGWRQAALWEELADSVEEPSDYEAIRDLWLATPAACHRDPTLLAAVGRAAMKANEPAEGRALLEAATFRSGQRATST